jgi:dsDNA-binding SOS-regulon protein
MAVIALETSEQLSRALGNAVVKMWGCLPADLQYRLFEAAVSSHDEELRPRLALYLHENHPRTSAALKARAMLEPDSLGG